MISRQSKFDIEAENYITVELRSNKVENFIKV